MPECVGSPAPLPPGNRLFVNGEEVMPTGPCVLKAFANIQEHSCYDPLLEEETVFHTSATYVFEVYFGDTLYAVADEIKVDRHKNEVHLDRAQILNLFMDT